MPEPELLFVNGSDPRFGHAPALAALDRVGCAVDLLLKTAAAERA